MFVRVQLELERMSSRSEPGFVRIYGPRDQLVLCGGARVCSVTGEAVVGRRERVILTAVADCFWGEFEPELLSGVGLRN